MRAQIKDITLAYDVNGSGRPVLFLHGYPLNRKSWQSQVEVLIDVGQVIALDQRDRGRGGAGVADPGAATEDVGIVQFALTGGGGMEHGEK